MKDFIIKVGGFYEGLNLSYTSFSLIIINLIGGAGLWIKI